MVTVNTNQQQQTQFVNLTPHDIIWLGEDYRIFPPSGELCSVISSSPDELGDTLDIPGLGGVSVRKVPREPGFIRGLPEPVDGTIYLVSGMVIDTLLQLGIERCDVFTPAARKKYGAIYDSSNRICGVRALVGL